MLRRMEDWLAWMFAHQKILEESRKIQPNPKPADSVFKTNVTRNACTVLVKNKIQVDHSDVQSKEQVTEVVTVLDNLDTLQEVMKVDTVIESVSTQ